MLVISETNIWEGNIGRFGRCIWWRGMYWVKEIFVKIVNPFCRDVVNSYKGWELHIIGSRMNLDAVLVYIKEFIRWPKLPYRFIQSLHVVHSCFMPVIGTYFYTWKLTVLSIIYIYIMVVTLVILVLIKSVLMEKIVIVCY